ncbi:DUF3108 domain-containing protein [Sulfurovum sp. zt1-1]|uniref:DUF3108 domain-containing protein n=1 Tax=Sulfurovum zhangzhouensis TaxID=3019067 RepID=A0ABT7QWN4_9BACT|nr:DUF3108 domain-containing protein [Sulfurovum zhangzhouensis]MDM5271250.1 DUF3108 domain-containing protein [Sulfurovum zhangzhouensis]
MRKYLLLSFFVWISWLNAQAIDVKYQVKFGILGELGVSHAHLETNGDNYKISINAHATGMAKTLSRNRKETHISEGFIKNGQYYTKRYSIQVEHGEQKKEKVYTVDYAKKIVTKISKKYKKGKLVSQSNQTLDFFSTNDLLTLYFNLPALIDGNAKPGTYTFNAIGAERQKGKVEIYLPKSDELKKYENALGKGEYRYLTAIIYQKIFSSNKGELMIAIGKDGITQKAVLKDLVMFGDLRAERVK